MALLGVLRAFPGEPEKVQAAVANVAPTALVTEARLHGLSALVQHALAASHVVLGASDAARLSGEALAMAGGTLRAKALLLETLDAMAAARLSPVLLKGYALGARLYPEPLLRPTSDADLLLAEADLPRASAALRGRGFQPMEAMAEAYHREHHHHVTFAGPRGVVELHFRLMTGFGATLEGDAPYRRAVPIDAPPALAAELKASGARRLTLEDEVLYLAAHAANHLFSRLAWLYDLKLLLRTGTPDWNQVVSAAHASGLAGPAHVALTLARRAVGADVPLPALEALRPSSWHRTLETRVFTDARLEASPWLEWKWTSFALTTALSSTPLAGVRFAAHNTARGLRRKLAKRFPGSTPDAWRG